jgi:cyclopropane fatty-acyl-phospholipid synthase-like methyltransferase
MNLGYKHIIGKAHYHNREKVIIDQLLHKFGNKSQASLLDVGCGIGEYVDVFTKHKLDFTGVDISREMVDNANSKGHHAILLTELEIQTKQYDIIFISHVIEHLNTENLIEFMNFYLGKLKKGGFLLLLSPLGVDNFHYDITHVRPYYPQAIWQMWGGYTSSLSIKKNEQIKLVDIYFVKDSYRTRKWRSYYIQDNWLHTTATKIINYITASLYLLTNASFGKKVSWIGVYKKI